MEIEESILIKEVPVSSDDAGILLEELNKTLENITGASGATSFEVSDMEESRAAFMMAFVNYQPVGCGAIRELSQDTAELKRVYARKNHLGIAHKLVNALEQKATQNGYKFIQLETRKVNKHAVEFYQACGYKVVSNYGKYVGRDEAICFEKELR